MLIYYELKHLINLWQSKKGESVLGTNHTATLLSLHILLFLTPFLHRTSTVKHVSTPPPPPPFFSYLIAIEGTPAPEPVPAHVAPNNRARNLNLKGADGTPSLLNGSETR
jgi:hypothetical protein